jgi:hypothetical protein
MRALRFVPTLLLVGACATACASARPGIFPVQPADPAPSNDQAQARFSKAVRALDRAEFGAARPDLEWLVSHCDAGWAGRSALLLLASADLDLANADRSPAEAARLARTYLLLPDDSRGQEADGELPLARSLYLLALDVNDGHGAVAGSRSSVATSGPGDARHRASGPAPMPIAERFNHCDEPGTPKPAATLPAPSWPTAATRLVGLHAALAEATDSLTRARRRLADQAEKITALEAEIERIRKLLNAGGGVEPPARR